ncbi:MAG: hypothetical protein KAQ68_06695 [Clostridiales bacterium]|nr:hypothetical protein [Clostridiales bacterium]
MTIWQKTGPENDVVLSVRLRIARNFSDIAFPTSMNIKDSVEVKQRILSLSRELEEFKFRYYDFASISKIEIKTFIERHLCSKELSRTQQMSGLLLSTDESVSIMMNEEDHIRAQILAVGLDYETVRIKADHIKKAFDQGENIAYKKEIGYLTSCPTNLGTGMRASAMIRIPAIIVTGAFKQMAKRLSDEGYILRGIYGEGSASVGGIMQLSNSRVVATNEDEIIAKVLDVCMQVVKEERQQRVKITKKRSIRLEDKIMRSYGILKHAMRISQKEMGILVGDIWLGKDLGLIKNLDDSEFMHLLTSTHDATLQINKGEQKNRGILNIMRARYIQEYMKEKECI